jgi:hypothetical protein
LDRDFQAAAAKGLIPPPTTVTGVVVAVALAALERLFQMQELHLFKKFQVAQEQQQTYSVAYCILVVAEQVELITVAAIAMAVLVEVEVDQSITQAHILIDQLLVTEATAAASH